jgi:hypothetical protein
LFLKCNEAMPVCESVRCGAMHTGYRNNPK